MIVVQEIIVTWTKRARGGKAASVRNAVPEAFSLPHLPEVAFPLALILDRVAMGLHQKRVLTVEEIVPKKRRPVACTALTWADDLLTVTFPTKDYCTGAPQRFGPRTVLTLKPGLWGRVRYNGRYIGSFEGHWYYQKTVLNIGCFETVSESVFLSEPNRVFSDMRQLF